MLLTDSCSESIVFVYLNYSLKIITMPKLFQTEWGLTICGLSLFLWMRGVKGSHRVADRAHYMKEWYPVPTTSGQAEKSIRSHYVIDGNELGDRTLSPTTSDWRIWNPKLWPIRCDWCIAKLTIGDRVPLSPELTTFITGIRSEFSTLSKHSHV